MKKTLILSVLILSGCEEPPRVLTASQQELMAKYPLDARVYMEDCLSFYLSTFSDCQRRMVADLTTPKSVVQTDGNSVVKTAVGTAIGYGAVKLLTK